MLYIKTNHGGNSKTNSISLSCFIQRGGLVFFNVKQGKTNWRGRLSTVVLLVKVSCFVTKVKNIFDFKCSWSKLVSMRNWAFPLSKVSPVKPIIVFYIFSWKQINCILRGFVVYGWLIITRYFISYLTDQISSQFYQQ